MPGIKTSAITYRRGISNNTPNFFLVAQSNYVIPQPINKFKINNVINAPAPTPAPVPLGPSSGTFIYTFFNSTDANISTYIPFITTNGKISYTFTTSILNSVTKETRVTINWSTASDFYTNLPNLDGLSFANVNTFYNANSPNTITVESFNNVPLSRNSQYLFAGMENLIFTATDTPTITQNTSLWYCFLGSTNFNSPIGNWDVSKVTGMLGMFTNCVAFNQPIGSWNVSNVTDMRYMFAGNTSFNQPIGNWNVSNVTQMGSLMDGNTAFNQNLSNWDVSKLVDGSAMFRNATSFNNGAAAGLSTNPLNWTLTKLGNSSYMFNNATSFNSPINNWNMPDLNNASIMFQGASSFNQNLSNWYIPNLANIDTIFTNATIFNNGEGADETTAPLGANWNNLSGYPNEYRSGSSLTPQNASPLP